MKLLKTSIKGFFYHENSKGITYYYNYRNKEKQQSIRKKIYSCSEHNNKNLQHAITIKEDILKKEIAKAIFKETEKSIKNEKNKKNIVKSIENMDEELNVEDFTLNEIIDLHHNKYYNQKVRELKEFYVGYSEEDFNNNAVVKKKLYGIKRRLLQYNKNIRNSTIGQMKFSQITKRNINIFIEKELNQNLALKTKYNIMTYIRAATNSMKRNDYIKIDNVFDKIKIKNDKRQRTRVLNANEIELLLTECKKWNKPLEVEIKRKDTNKTYMRTRKANYSIYTAVYLAIITAARSSTVLTIKKEDIDLKNGTIKLINHKAGGDTYFIPMNRSSIKWFEKKLQYYKDGDYLLQPNTKQGREKVGKNNSLTFIPREVFEIMNRLFNEGINRKINLERDNMVNFHTLRRSVATNLAKSGVMSIYKIKKLLDHRSIDITETYLNLSYLDYKDNLELYHNELFNGFKGILDENEEEKQPITDLKEKLINSILTMSGNEDNEILKTSLEILSEEELKKKLTTYI